MHVSKSILTHQSLYHVHSLAPHLSQKLVHVEGVLDPKPVHHRVQSNKSTSAAHPSAAVDDQGNASSLVMALLHAVDETNK